MMPSFDEAGKFGEEFAVTGLESFASLSRSMRTIATEATEYSRRAFENGGAAVDRIVTAKSPDAAMKAQADYARLAYEDFVAEATRMGELYAEMAKEAYKPFESVAASAK